MTTRQELTEAVGERYRRSDRNEKREILDEFVQVTGYHRKHAIRVPCREPQPPRARPGPQRRYDDEVRDALVTLWEAADRICGKRLKALIPTLIDSMTRHGHLTLSKQLRQRMNQISAATIDRLLRDVREQAFAGQRRRAGGVGNAIRRAVPICCANTLMPTNVMPTRAVPKIASSFNANAIASGYSAVRRALTLPPIFRTTAPQIA
jgi:hypothetical protein